MGTLRNIRSVELFNKQGPVAEIQNPEVFIQNTALGDQISIDLSDLPFTVISKSVISDQDSMQVVPAAVDPNPNKTQYPTPHFGVDLATGTDHQSEITWANQAGFTKTPEQVELIEQQAFENGSKEMLNDCKAGRYAKSEEIYNATQVKMLINEAIRKHNETTAIMLNHLKGRYDLPADVDQMIQDLELAGKEAHNG